MPDLIAALPMYDTGPAAAANDALWAFMRDRLRADGVPAPGALTRGVPLDDIWRSPNLLFAQTCGYPYWMSLRDYVDVLATPVYDFPGCDGPTHCSFIVMRADDKRATLAEFRSARAAINARDSNTGMNLFRASVAPLACGGRFFGEVFVTGAHAASLRSVASGETDVCAVDCVTFGLIKRDNPGAIENLRVLSQTPSTAGLPFVASRELPDLTRRTVIGALTKAMESSELSDIRAALGLTAIAHQGNSAYARVGELEAEAIGLKYSHLA